VPKVFPAGRTGNHLLNLLTSVNFRSLEPMLEKKELKTGEVLYEARAPINFVYFPINCVLSAVTVMSDGHAIEVATMGNEGLSGLATLAPVATSPHRVFAQIAGEALRVNAASFNKECGGNPDLGKIMTSYQQAFLFQISQSVACNGLHVIVERCSRWLLITHDRVDGDELTLTHEFLSFMLGVRRSSVTEVLQSLQKQDLIRYTQGRITITNRPGLEELACECYRCVRDEYDRLLG
jgi:CRP-like cAMP-binding protein